MVHVAKPLLMAVALLLVLPCAGSTSDTGDAQTPRETRQSHVLKPQTPAIKQNRPAQKPIDPARFAFVRQNLISTFYHELAHAMIDMMTLPVLGQEEDAADVFSALMIQRLFDPKAAKSITLGALRGAKIDAEQLRQTNQIWDFSDVHGPNRQRYFNLACLYYGADPEGHTDFAAQTGLPEDRAKTCAEEYSLASRSWGPIIDRLAHHYPANIKIRLREKTRSNLHRAAVDVIKTEVSRMNAAYHLPQTLRVYIKRCKRRAAFFAYYSTGRKSITFCTNYIDDLYQDAQQ